MVSKFTNLATYSVTELSVNHQALVGRVCRLLSSSAIKVGGRGWAYRRMGTHLTRLTEEESMMKETGALCETVSL